MATITATGSKRQIIHKGVFVKHATAVVCLSVLVFILACKGRGQKFSSTVRVADEIAQLRNQLKSSPNSASLHGQLAAMLAAQGDWDASDKETAVAMQLDPNDAMLRIEAAQRYQSRGMAEKAIDLLKHSLEIDSKNPLSHFNLGLIYESKHDSENAIVQFREAALLIDSLSLPASSPDPRNRIIKGTHGEIWYHDQFGKDYSLNAILKPLQLNGTFRLQIRSSCLNKGLQKDELILHEDGRLEQHSVFASGKRYDATNETWSYVPQDSVSLQKWMDFTDNPSGKPIGAVLLVNLGNPPSILVNPDSDCVYVKQ